MNIKIIFILLTCINIGYAKTILTLLGVLSQNHRIWCNAIFQNLLKRGHSIINFSADKRTIYHPNFKHIQLEKIIKYYRGNVSESYIVDNFHASSNWGRLEYWHKNNRLICDGTLESDKFAQVFNAEFLINSSIDLIMYDVTHGQTCLLSAAMAYPDVPIVGLSPSHLTPDVFEMARGGQIHALTIPFFLSDYSEDMNFLQRIFNVILYWSHIYDRTATWNEVMLRTLQKNKIINDRKISFDMDAIHNRLLFILANIHPSIDYGRPLPQNIIEVGGLHIEDKFDLVTEKMKIFYNGREVILVDITSEPLADCRKRYHDAVLSLVKQYQQIAFFWIANVEDFGDVVLPKNLYIDKRLPIFDILALWNTQAYITNAAKLRIQEAAHYGVPIIAVTMKNDEINNAVRATERGLGLWVDYDSFNYENLKKMFIRVAIRKEFTKRTKRLQIAYHVRTNVPMDVALYWIDQALELPIETYNHFTQNVDYRQHYISTHYWEFFFIVQGLVFQAFIIYRITLKYQRHRLERLGVQPVIRRQRLNVFRHFHLNYFRNVRD